MKRIKDRHLLVQTNCFVGDVPFGPFILTQHPAVLQDLFQYLGVSWMNIPDIEIRFLHACTSEGQQVILPPFLETDGEWLGANPGILI